LFVVSFRTNNPTDADIGKECSHASPVLTTCANPLLRYTEQLEMERQRLEMESQRQLEMERQRQLEMERQRQLETERQLEMERQLEHQRQLELEQEVCF
jgi:hypothetical protein